MSTAVAPRAPSTLEQYRDDGPIARALPALRVPAAPLILAGGLPGLVLLAVERDEAEKPLVAASLLLFVLVAGLAKGSEDRLRWAVPPLLRLFEYGAILWLGALADAEASAFALMCALAFRHYDLVYRLRHQGVAPPQWVGDVAGGWDGRLIVGYVLMATGALPEGFFIAAAILAAVFVGDSVAGWRRFGRAQQPAVYEDEEEQDA